MTPADRRITELIDKWLTSVDLHLQYVELSDAAYARAQPWPKHDRPTRWVLEVARQKLLELKAQCETRQAMGDSKFAESLELMNFLANLVGIQNIQRFVPLADPSKESTGPSATQAVATQTATIQAATMQTGMSQTLEATVIKPQTAARARPTGDETTREMPRLKPVTATAEPIMVAPTAIPVPRTPLARTAAKTATKAVPAKVEAASKAAPTDMKGKIVADAIRLLKWGKSWHELADLIERIADRPPGSEIRKILRTHKSEIESKAAKDG